MRLDDIETGANRAGLTILGAFHPVSGQTRVLLGPDEPQFWPQFSTSPEYLDGAANPLDRWSARVIGALAIDIGAEAAFPFGGPPYHPFIDWALQSGRAWQSPVGMLVHERAGLFVSYRGALLIKQSLSLSALSQKPCDSCAERPCLSACPAAALGSGTYDVPACHAYLETPDGKDCLTNGCAARRACPVGQHRRIPEQSAFHMRAFHKG